MDLSQSCTTCKGETWRDAYAYAVYAEFYFFIVSSEVNAIIFFLYVFQGQPRLELKCFLVPAAFRMI